MVRISLHKASSSRHTRRVRLRSRVRGPGGAGSHGGRRAAWAAAAATRSCTNSYRHTRLSRLRSRDMGPCGGSAAAAASCAPGGGFHGTPMCGHKTAQQQRRAGHVLQSQHVQHYLQGAAHRLGTGQRATHPVPRGAGGRLSRGSGVRIHHSTDGRVAFSASHLNKIYISDIRPQGTSEAAPRRIGTH